MPALTHIDVQHLNEATRFISELRVHDLQGAVCESFERWCNACEAHLDTIRISEDDELASVFALVLAESKIFQPESSLNAVGLLQQESPAAQQAAWWRLRLASSRNVEPYLRAMLGKPKWDFASAAALDILAFHRLPVKAGIRETLYESSPQILWNCNAPSMNPN